MQRLYLHNIIFNKGYLINISHWFNVNSRLGKPYKIAEKQAACFILMLYFGVKHSG